MKVTLIEPAMIKKRRGLSEKPIFCIQPLALGVLAGLTPPGIEVELIDDRFELIDFDAPRDLVGISVKTFTARRAYQIADAFRARGTRVILGGHHASLLPDEAQEHADSVFVGEAEGLWPAVLEDARRGRLRRRYEGGRAPDYPRTQVNRALLEKKKYLPAAAVETARGCPYNCNFCTVSTFFGHTFRRRRTGEIVDEIRSQRHRTVLFVDDNIVGDPESAKALFAALAPLKIRWMSQASISMTRDAELMALMQTSGCAGVLVGIESLFGENLKAMRKGWNVARQDYAEALAVLRAHHIGVVGSFIVGLDHDTPESLDETLAFATGQRLFAVLFNMLTPFPGTDLYQAMERDGRLRYRRWWLDENYRYGQATFLPRHFSPEGLARKRMDLYRRFYGARSVIGRFLNRQANSPDLWRAAVYLMINAPGLAQEQARTGEPLGEKTR